MRMRLMLCSIDYAPGPEDQTDMAIMSTLLIVDGGALKGIIPAWLTCLRLGQDEVGVCDARTHLDIANRQGLGVVPPPVVLVWAQGNPRWQGRCALPCLARLPQIPLPRDAISRHCQPCALPTIAFLNRQRWAAIFGPLPTVSSPWAAHHTCCW